MYHPKKVFSHAPEQYALKAQDVFFEAPDHLRLHGWFFESKKTQKTLLFFHGNGGNVASNLELISIFVQKVHLNVFVIDYRGFGKSEGHPSETGLYQDAEAAYEYLTQVRKMDKDNIIIFGQSLGGAIAIDLASKRPASVLIVENTFTSAVAMAKVFYPYLPVRLFIKSKFDSLEKMKSIAMPKLIIHATEDETVPFQLGKKLFEVAATPKEFYAVLGAHHGNNYATGGPSYVEKLKKFTKVF
ncbi:MAG: alpha/beta hydrolase [Deltaproteobacteria bacterium]|nr:alpha/beta hydrolase [Deltaproteobacteria bacterium]